VEIPSFSSQIQRTLQLAEHIYTGKRSTLYENAKLKAGKCFLYKKNIHIGIQQTVTGELKATK
jgi:hypothetical protein